MKKHTSLKLSQMFAEARCEVESEYLWVFEYLEKDKWELVKTEDFCALNPNYPTYDLIWDICIKHPKEFFGETGYYTGNKFTGIKTMREAHNRVEEFKDGLFFKSFEEEAENVFKLIQQNKTQEAENYIIKHSIFFK